MLWFEDEFGEEDLIFAFVNLGYVRCASDLLVECRHKEIFTKNLHIVLFEYDLRSTACTGDSKFFAL